MDDQMDFVLDWETLGTDPDSVVLSLAFIPFPRNKILAFEEHLANAYYWKFDVVHQVELGRIINDDTLEWWGKQDPEVMKSQLEPSDEDVTLDVMLKELYDARKKHGINNKSLGYCRGPSFDYPLMADIIRMVKHMLDKQQYPINAAFFPCAFWNQMDVRSYIRGITMDKTATMVPLPKGSLNGFRHHNPIDDCARAIMHVQYAEAYVDEENPMEVPDEVDEFSFK